MGASNPPSDGATKLLRRASGWNQTGGCSSVWGVERCVSLVVLAAAVACQDGALISSAPDSETSPAVWEPVCGTDGPHRLIALAPGEHAHRVVPIPGEDRVLVSTFFVDPLVPLSALPPTIDLTTYAVGSCGEDPVEVAPGLGAPARIDDRHWLGCRDGGHGALLVDIAGAEVPRLVLEGWCPLRSTDYGVIGVAAGPDERLGTLVIVRDLDDPAAVPEPLAQNIRAPRNTYFGPGHNSTTSLWTSSTEVLALDGDGELQHFDLATGQRTSELTGVREFRVSGDGRWMVWQALDPAQGEPEAPQGPVFLRDRESQTDRHLLDTHLEYSGSVYAGDYVVVRDGTAGLRLFVRDTAQPLALPEGTEFRGLVDDTQMWLVVQDTELGSTDELLWTPGDGEPVVFARHASGTVARRGDGIEIFDRRASDVPNEGTLHRVSFDGGDPELLASRVHASRRTLADGRILTIVDEDDTGHGPLRLIDPEDGSVVVLDPLGFVQSPRLSGGDPFDGDVVFAVADPGGDRRGVYRAAVSR